MSFAPAAPPVGNSPYCQRLYDFTSTPSTIYIGWADLGAAASAAAWTINRIQLDAAQNPSAIQWSAINSVWNDRLIISYY